MESIGYASKTFLETKYGKMLDDTWDDPKKSLPRILKKVKKAAKKRMQYFTQIDNKNAVLVLEWLIKMRNATGHNDLPLLSPTANLRSYLSASELYLGPSMIHYPDGVVEVQAAFGKAGLTTISPLPRKPT